VPLTISLATNVVRCLRNVARITLVKAGGGVAHPTDRGCGSKTCVDRNVVLASEGQIIVIASVAVTVAEIGLVALVGRVGSTAEGTSRFLSVTGAVI